MRLASLVAVCAAVLTTGCDSGTCSTPPQPSVVSLTVHLPPEGVVALPETATVCDDSGCFSAEVPALGATHDFVVFGFKPPMTFASVSVHAGGVRALNVGWVLDGDPGKPAQAYSLQVDDANDVTTGLVANLLDYTVSEDACGRPVWSAELSD